MRFFLTFLLVIGVSGHGAMVSPAPRSSHKQTLDERNKCGSENPYSTTGINAGEYCGIGCLGDACLYYQVGCYAGCPTCSLQGKDLYPTAADLELAGQCKPIEPTLGGGDAAHEYELRTHNIDNLSQNGDWTKVNPWRAPGTAGRGNPQFQPCGINSGAKNYPLPPTTAEDVPKSGPGTSLPSIGNAATWKAGSVVDASWAIYANHGGGYSYRMCKKSADGAAPTEACFQQTPLAFVGNTTEIRFVDNRRAPFSIHAVTTSVGTYPKGSMWRKNPIPMCNCDIGIGCQNSEQTTQPLQSGGGKTCQADPQCNGNSFHCRECGNASAPAWSCKSGTCCPGFNEGEYAGGVYCKGGAPGPSPKPKNSMYTAYSKTHLHPGQSSKICPTGVHFETQFAEGMGASGESIGKFGTFMYTMTDKLQVPADLEKGEYTLSWRWDCEETPQVWNSCSDITIE